MAKSQLDMYIDNQEGILKEHNGQIIAVRDGQVMGEYPDKLTAYRDMKAMGLEDGQFMIVKCTPGSSAYTAQFANWYVFKGMTANV